MNKAAKIVGCIPAVFFMVIMAKAMSTDDPANPNGASWGECFQMAWQQWWSN